MIWVCLDDALKLVAFLVELAYAQFLVFNYSLTIAFPQSSSY